MSYFILLIFQIHFWGSILLDEAEQVKINLYKDNNNTNNNIFIANTKARQRNELVL